MSEQLKSIEFDSAHSMPKDIMRSVAERGAAAVYDFVPRQDQWVAAALLNHESMQRDKTEGEVPRDQELSFYAFDGTGPEPIEPSSYQVEKKVRQAPPVIHQLGRRVSEFVKLGGLPWWPNEIIGHRYGKDGFIGPHHDYKAASGVIAVMTLEGEQVFHVRLDGDDTDTSVTMVPGTLTLLRGYKGLPDDRPEHWVDAPLTPSRTAISVRQMNSDLIRLPGLA